MPASEVAGNEYGARAGALTLHRVAGPGEPQPAAPAEDTLFVSDQLERWLRDCPAGPLGPGPESEPVLTALLDGWCSTVVHALAAEPLTPAEASEAVEGPGRGAVEEQIKAMEAAGLLVARQDTDGEWRFAPTEWLRLAIAPLAVAARLELRNPGGETAPIAPLDVEAAFLLTVPLLTPPAEAYASCRLLVTVPGRPPRLAGVVVLIEDGLLTAVTADLRMASDTFAAGTPGDWIDTLIDPSLGRVSLEGNLEVLQGLLLGLHEKLFPLPTA